MVPGGFRRIALLCFINQFWINDIGWPQQPLTEKVADISKKMEFWWFIPQNGTVIGHLGVKDDQTIRISNLFWWNEAVEVIEAIEAVEATEVMEAAEVLRHGKSLLRTSESCRHLNSALFLCFEKKFFWVGSWNTYWILAPLLSEAAEASRCHFFFKTGWWNTKVQSSRSHQAP